MSQETAVLNQERTAGVCQVSAMRESASRYPGVLVSLEADLEREFEDRLQESSALAVRVAFSVLRQHEDAEDVAQEAFARAFRHFASLRDPVRFRGWLVRVTWRLAIDRWRANRRRRSREETAAPPTVLESAEARVDQAVRADRLWESIDALPEKLRVVLVLAAIEGHSLGNVAELLRIPEGTVKSRLFLARKALVEKLKCLANDKGASA
jgi:RNA polymerase sigma-70 factor (ECF subfamily)